MIILMIFDTFDDLIIYHISYIIYHITSKHPKHLLAPRSTTSHTQTQTHKHTYTYTHTHTHTHTHIHTYAHACSMRTCGLSPCPAAGRCRRPLSMPYMDTVYTLVHGLKSAMIQDTYGRCRRPCGMPCRIEHVPVVYISDANHVYLCVHVSPVHQSGHGHHTLRV